MREGCRGVRFPGARTWPRWVAGREAAEAIRGITGPRRQGPSLKAGTHARCWVRPGERGKHGAVGDIGRTGVSTCTCPFSQLQELSPPPPCSSLPQPKT